MGNQILVIALVDGFGEIVILQGEHLRKWHNYIMDIPSKQRVTACRATRIAVYACYSSFGNGKRGLQATRCLGNRAHNHALAGKKRVERKKKTMKR
jgi:hypothetical protein